jgi:AcrR family transcriptional regulator
MGGINLKAATKRNPERTKERIHKAALEEFSAHGFGGARVDVIAERASVNKRMLYHYFGKKDDLFLHVMEQAYEKIRSHEARLELTSMEPGKAVRELVGFTFNYFVDNPELIRLLNIENLHHAEHILKSRKIKAMHSPLLVMMTDVLKRGEAAGAFRPGVDPMQFYITVASGAYFYLSNIHTLSAIFGRDLSTREALDARLDHCIEVVQGYLRP